MTDRIWFITGSSTGLGRMVAERALAAGHRVVATARRPEVLDDLVALYPERALALRLDVTNHRQIDDAIDAAIARFGALDIVVNNAGYGLIGALEECGEAQIRANIETNLFGTINVLRAAIPHLRTQKSGHLVLMSAVAGLANHEGFSIYGATKFALEGIGEAVKLELGPLGVNVTLIEPGPFRTDFIGRSLERAERTIDDYRATSGKFAAYLDKIAGSQPGDPAKAAEAIISAITAAQPPLRLVLGKFAHFFVRKKLDRMAAEMKEWEAIGMPTDF